MDNSTLYERCFHYIPSVYSFTAWVSVYLLLLPIFLLVLYVGFNKWRRPGSSVSGGGLSHCDVLTLNMVVMELSSIAASCYALYGFYSLNKHAVNVGSEMLLTTITGQMLFHGLTSVERHLAVVHPITYLRLKRGAGVTVRNVSVVVVWVLSPVHAVLFRFVKCRLCYELTTIILLLVPPPLIAYCSISVLRILTRPKPGERGGGGNQIDQSKRTTVHAMAAILGALLLRVIADVGFRASMISSLPEVDKCLISVSCAWTILPTSLVLPLLFLQRAGKFICK